MKYTYFTIIDLVNVPSFCRKKFLVYISLTLALDRARNLRLYHHKAVEKLFPRSLPPHVLKRQIL